MNNSALAGVDGYDVEPMAVFFERMTSHQRKFAEQVIRLACKYFPDADHYFSGGVDKKYIDLRVGVRARGRFRGRPYFWLWLDNGDLRFRANKVRVPDSCLGKQGRGLNASEVDDQVDLDGWFKTLAAKMKKQQIHIAGSSLRPANYDVTDVEYGEEMPEVVSAGKAVGSKNNISLNKILYGPPGTGKTYATIDAALEIIEPSALLLERPERHARFRELVTEKRVRFVTFHQSFSYEDFVEGLRPLPPGSDENPGAALSYDVAKGVFVQLCLDAASDPVMGEKLGLKDDPTIWKISIEEASSDGRTRRYCLQQGEARIGWDQTGDLRHANLADPALKLGSNDQGSLDSFVRGIEPGDMLVCLGTRKSICAVGVVTGEYDYQPQVPQGVREDYVHRLPVNWLLTDIDLDITALNGGVGLTLKTLYRMSRLSWPELKGALQQAGHSLASEDPAAPGEKLPYVLIIDEINRGNVSRIFGELITLIEPSKRAGADEELEVLLPYSKRPFSVPDNVYLIGTMNTADRSLAGLDIALRRRFTFREMPPRPDLLDKVVVAGVNIGQLLRVMNQRIEVLLDRDHCLGHAYFMPLESDPSLARMESIFRNQVLPLLQEYFFEDWQRIQWVLNDHRKAALDRFVSQCQSDVQVLFGNGMEVSAHNLPWSINEDAFQRVTAYAGIVSVQAKLETPAEVLEAAEA